jgi:ABC-type bacteriocin/lantibiotic exporter with double-glycine peptidase domain
MKSYEQIMNPLLIFNRLYFTPTVVCPIFVSLNNKDRFSVMTAIERFWSLMKIYKSEIRQIYIYAIFSGLVTLSLPLGIQAIINYIQLGEVTSSWMILVVFVLAGIAISGSFQVVQLKLVEIIQQDIFARSGFEFAYRIPKINLLELDKLYAAELVNRFFDTLTIQKGLPKVLIDFSLAAFQIIFGLILLGIYSPIFIIYGVALVFLLYLILKVTGPRGLKTSLKESSFKYKLAFWLEEIARVNRTFKVNAQQEHHLNKTDKISSKYIVARKNHFQVLLTQFNLFIAFKVIVAAGLLILGGVLVFNEQMSIGQFVAAEIIIITVINSVEKILRIIDTIYDVLTALEKIGFVTDLKLDEYTGTQKISGHKGFQIQAKELSFQFPDMPRPVFNHLNFSISQGDKVFLDGESGSGKSTLLQLIAGVYNIQKGDILFDDVSVQNLNRDILNQEIRLIYPNNQLFEGTYRENLCFGKETKEEEIMEALDLVGLTQHYRNLPDGLDTDLNLFGNHISRSVVQRLHIVRAILNNPRLIILESPMHFVEEDIKKRVIDYLTAEDKDWTLLVASDYPYWKEKCNLELQINLGHA